MVKCSGIAEGSDLSSENVAPSLFVSHVVVGWPVVTIL